VSDPATAVYALPHTLGCREPLVRVHKFGALLRRNAVPGCDGQDAAIIVESANIDENFAAVLVYLCAALGWTHDKFHRENPLLRMSMVRHQRVARKACLTVQQDIPGPYFGSYSRVTRDAKLLSKLLMVSIW
jgi:hypothetical protein